MSSEAQPAQDLQLWGEIARKRKREWAASPQGKARAAKHQQQRWFQVAVPIQETTRSSNSAMLGTVSTVTDAQHEQGLAIELVEDEGFELWQAGFVFQETGSITRDKLLSTGQSGQTTGVVVGVYLFRATDLPARDDEIWRVEAEALYKEALAAKLSKP